MKRMGDWGRSPSNGFAILAHACARLPLRHDMTAGMSIMQVMVHSVAHCAISHFSVLHHISAGELQGWSLGVMQSLTSGIE